MKNKEYAFKLTYLNYSFALSLSSKYCLKYKLNEVTTAIDGTVGIFCFRSLKDVKHFTPKLEFDRGYILYLVEGYTKKKVPELISFADSWNIEYFYRNNKKGDAKIPHGTVCYKSVIPIRKITQEEFDKGELID
jgi:hypothetical protein